jgi:hypothetical protein
VQRNTRGADQARLARNAMNRSQNLGGNAASTRHDDRHVAMKEKLALSLCLAAIASPMDLSGTSRSPRTPSIWHDTKGWKQTFDEITYTKTFEGKPCGQTGYEH